MEKCDDDCAVGHNIVVSDDVKSYILQRNIDFRVCTTCGGPVLLATVVKPPKPSDLEIYVGDNIIYVSMYQARYLDRIDMEMITAYGDYH